MGDGGLICRRVVLVDRRKANVPIIVFMGARTSRHSIAWLKDFRRAIGDIPWIVEGYRFTGETDFCSAWWCQT